MKLIDVSMDGFDYQTVLLDRDGTINRQRQGDYVKCCEEFEFLQGAKEAIAGMAKVARHIFIVTNQRGVGKGLMSEADLKRIHDAMIKEIAAAGGRIDKIYVATAVDKADGMRKPQTGLWQLILKDYPDVDPASTVMIGDSDSDMEFARNCGIKGIKIDSEDVIFVKNSTDDSADDFPDNA